MKIVSWNLNGLMATLKSDPFSRQDLFEPDVVCFQEIRTAQEPVIFPDYYHFWNHGDISGYSGTVLLSKQEPVNVVFGFPDGDFTDTEGRIITAEYPDVTVVNVYVPNAQKGRSGGLRRQAYRLKWDQALYEYAASLLEEKPLVICGDFNVVRSDLDFFEENTRQYWASQGFASDEQSQLEDLLDLGLADVFRTLYPNERSYTWWSSRLQKRGEDRGWRLDYFLISESLIGDVKEIRHLQEVQGSDHCPIMLEVEI